MSEWKTLSECDAWIEKHITNKPGKYTSELPAAIDLYNKMVELGCVASLFREPGEPQQCAIWDASKPSRIVKATASTIPEAIGIAAARYLDTYLQPKQEKQ